MHSLFLGKLAAHPVFTQSDRSSYGQQEQERGIQAIA